MGQFWGLYFKKLSSVPASSSLPPSRSLEKKTTETRVTPQEWLERIWVPGGIEEQRCHTALSCLWTDLDECEK